MKIVIKNESNHRMFIQGDCSNPVTYINYCNINNYKIFRVMNVSYYDLLTFDYYTWLLEIDEVIMFEMHDKNCMNTKMEIIKSADINYYFILNTLLPDMSKTKLDHFGIGHWTFECAINIMNYLILKNKYPSLKLVVSTKKKYKELFFNFFKIPENDILYINNELTTPNICFFPSPVTCLNSNGAHVDIYKGLLIYFFNLFNNIIVEIRDLYEYVILPRQTKENGHYANSDRACHLIKIINYVKEKNINHYILNTDLIDNLEDQIRIVRSSKKIILLDGSALMVNSLFIKDSDIYVIGPLYTRNRNDYPNTMKILETSKEMNNNRIYYFDTEEDFLEKNQSIINSAKASSFLHTG